MTNDGCALAEKLETVTEDSLSPGVAGSTALFAVDSTKSSSSGCSDDQICDRKSIILTAEMASRNSKPVQILDVDESEDLHTNSDSIHSFTSIKETRKEKIITRCVKIL